MCTYTYKYTALICMCTYTHKHRKIGWVEAGSGDRQGAIPYKRIISGLAGVTKTSEPLPVGEAVLK